MHFNAFNAFLPRVVEPEGEMHCISMHFNAFNAFQCNATPELRWLKSWTHVEGEERKVLSGLFPEKNEVEVSVL